MTQKDAFISNDMPLQKLSLTFIYKNKSFLSATSILSRSPMAYNTTASLNKLICTDYVDFGKYQHRFGPFSWFKNDSNYLDVKLKVFKKDDIKEFQLVQNFTMREAYFNQFMRLRSQLVNAAENIAREENFSPVLIHTMSQKYGWTTQTGSQGSWRSRPTKQNNLCDSAGVQCGPAWQF